MVIQLLDLFGDNPVALDVARKQEPYWEFRLSAELLRHNLKEPAQRWHDLQDGLLTRRFDRIPAGEAMPWIQVKIEEASSFLDPLQVLYTQRLPASWGEPGQPGDVEEIAHACSLIGNTASELVRWEEDIAFTRLPEAFEGIRQGLAGAAGHQLKELMKIPDVLQFGIDQAEEAVEGQPTVVKHTIVFDLPKGWSENLHHEFAKLNALINAGQI